MSSGDKGSRYVLASLIMMLALSSAPIRAEDAVPRCVNGSAGPYATLALLRRKPGVSETDFFAYWRDVHGMLATRIPGFWSYRQYHIHGEVMRLRRLPQGYTKPIEPLDGFADVSFCSAEDIAGLASSPQAELIKQDEKNLFASSYLYGAAPGNSLTLYSKMPFAELVGEASNDSLIVLLARGPAESHPAFRQALMKAAQALPEQCQHLQRLRVNIFQPYDADAWPAPEVNHRPAQVLDAAVELQFPDRAKALECLAGSAGFQRGSGDKAGQRLQLVYSVSRRYPMVVDSQVTLLGWRGLPAIELIQRLGAENQKSEPVLRAVYGRETLQ